MESVTMLNNIGWNIIDILSTYLYKHFCLDYCLKMHLRMIKNVQLRQNCNNGIKWDYWESYIILLFILRPALNALKYLWKSVREKWFDKIMRLIGIFGMRCWIRHYFVVRVNRHLLSLMLLMSVVYKKMPYF